MAKQDRYVVYTFLKEDFQIDISHKNGKIDLYSLKNGYRSTTYNSIDFKTIEETFEYIKKIYAEKVNSLLDL